MNVKERKIAELIAPTVEELGCELWGVDHHAAGKHSKLVIYIENVQDGISVEDCERVSRAVSDLMDVEGVMASAAYDLEVSSPGMDRILFNLAQYEQAVGEQVDVRLNVPVDKRKRVTGQLVGVEQEQAIVRSGEEEYLLPIEAIARTRVVPNYEIGKRQSERQKKSGKAGPKPVPANDDQDS